ncbi:MAG: glycosyltransferase [bacterium]|nr:glycosyltransferase [bacterium]
MSYLWGLLILVCLVYILIQIFYLFLLLKTRSKSHASLIDYPQISILVAARNEENNILHCLESIEQLDYPKDKIEILIGNDSSTDSTANIIEAFIAHHPQFKCIHLTGDEFPQTKGKARVLAVLAQAAKGEILMITDADIIVNPQWAKGMTHALMESKSGLVAGVTNIKANNLFTSFQQVDWLYFMGIFYAFSSIKKPISAVGNNMAFLKKAYLETGGYENIPFSITEDYALFKAIRRKGYSTMQLMDKDTLLYSKPIDTFSGLMRQRKRWLVGGYDLPAYYRLMIFIFGAWYIALPVLLFTHFWLLAIGMLVSKEFIQLFQILNINKKLNLKTEHPIAVLFYDIYLFLIIPATLAFFLLPGKTVWKGRKY